MPTLTIQLPGLPPVDHILRDEMMTIGRMKGNTIALDDVSVSVSHAKITRKGVEFFLKDLNSTNGTMLNGQSINEARLKDGDQLKFGEVIAIYHSEPDFISIAPAQNPAAVPAPQPVVAPSAPAPAPAPQPAIASTAFVSKRLVTQASQMSQAVAAPAQTTVTTRVKRGNSKTPPWLIPAAVGGVVMVVVVGIMAKFFMGNAAAPKTPAPPNSPTASATVPAKNPPANVPAKPGSTLAPKNSTPVPTDNKSLAGLKKALQAADPAERRRAAAALHALGAGAKDALTELHNALNDADPDVRMWSALALVNNKSYDQGEIPILIQTLHHDNSMLRQVSCLSLALIPYQDADKDTVVAALGDTANKDEDDDVRKAAVSALKIIAPESVPAGK